MGIVAVDAGVAVHGVGGHGDVGAGRNVIATDRYPAGGDEAFDCGAVGRMEPHGFF